MKIKVLRVHSPECAFVQYAHMNRPPAWYPLGEEILLDAVGQKRSTGYRWLVFICPDDRRCSAKCIVRLDTILDDIHAVTGVPVQEVKSR